MTLVNGETPEEKRKRRETERKKERKKHVLIFLCIIAGVFAVQFLGWYLMDEYITSCDPKITSQEKRAQFGDMFGAVNTLFSGMAFGCIIYTILLQRADLEATRQEMERSADAQEENANLLSGQNTLLEKSIAIEEVKLRDLVLPIFAEGSSPTMQQAGASKWNYDHRIVNHGREIRNFNINPSTEDMHINIVANRFPFIGANKTFRLQYSVEGDGVIYGSFDVSFETVDNRRWTTQFLLEAHVGRGASIYFKSISEKTNTEK